MLSLSSKCFSLLPPLINSDPTPPTDLQLPSHSQSTTQVKMGDAGIMASEQPKITSHENERLLDTIDRMRAQGISRYIDIPQIVVCGDQSSGMCNCLNLYRP